MIAATKRSSGRDVDPQLLGLYRLAYAAFRLGQASMAAEICSEDDPEKLRLRKMASRYLTELSLLLQPTSTPTRRDSLVG
jgi:hypothetical protein